MYSITGNCPACGDAMMVTELKCGNCGTTITGEFEIGKFLRLNKDQIKFVESLIRCRGSIKVMEKDLGISYPTIKNRLDEVISTMELEPPQDKSNSEYVNINRVDILNKIESGDITVDEAAELLKN